MNRRNREWQFEEDYFDTTKIKRVCQISPFTKIVLSTIVSLIWLCVTQGTPRIDTMSGLTYVDTTLQQIFETTLAIEKKRFTKRIVQESQGIWSYVPYINQHMWVELEIILTTRIGFDIKNEGNTIATFSPDGRLQVQVFEPTVLHKQWQTKIIDKSDSFFAKWDIKDFKLLEKQLLEQLAQAQSLQLLEQFKGDPRKMGELTHRLDQMMQTKKSFMTAPLQWIGKLNRMIDGKVHQLTGSFINTQTSEQLNFSSNQSYVPKQTAKRIGKKQSEKTYVKQNSKKESTFKQIAYSDQQNVMRQNMKNQLDF